MENKVRSGCRAQKPSGRRNTSRPSAAPVDRENDYPRISKRSNSRSLWHSRARIQARRLRPRRTPATSARFRADRSLGDVMSKPPSSRRASRLDIAAPFTRLGRAVAQTGSISRPISTFGGKGCCTNFRLRSGDKLSIKLDYKCCGVRAKVAGRESCGGAAIGTTANLGVSLDFFFLVFARICVPPKNHSAPITVMVPPSVCSAPNTVRRLLMPELSV